MSQAFLMRQRGSGAGLFQVLLLQFGSEDDTQGQAVIGVFQVTAKHGGDVGKAIEEGGAVQVKSGGGFGDGEVIVKVHPQGVQIGHLGVAVVLLQPFQPFCVEDPAGAACQGSAEKLGKQIVLEEKDGGDATAQHPVLQRGGGLEPGVPGIVQAGKHRGDAAGNSQLFQNGGQCVRGG